MGPSTLPDLFRSRAASITPLLSILAILLFAAACRDLPTAPNEATILAAANKPDGPPGQDKPKPPKDDPSADFAWALQAVDGASNTFTVWASSESDVWMAGGYRVLWHFDGSSWSSNSLSLPPTTWNTNTVYGFTASEVFLAGQRGVDRFDGTGWSNVLGGVGELFGIWGTSPSDLFVSGDGRFLHFDGTGWTNIPTGLSTAFNTHRLLGVWGSASNDVYAAGYGARILHWDGSQIRLVMEEPGQHVHAIHGSSRRNVFAVGTNGKIWHFNGRSWTSMESGTTVALNGIAVLSRDEAYAAGNDGTLLRYDGKAWSPIDSGTTLHLFNIFALSDKRIYIATIPGSVLVGTR